MSTLTRSPVTACASCPGSTSSSPSSLRNNRWRCDHGWDIDLDDGSSNYHIENNLCLNGGIKLREGFDRICENNIMVNNSFHPHVWFRGSDDIFRRNIVFARYAPIEVPKPWGGECDYNLLHQPGKHAATPAVVLQEQSGRDQHSLEADAHFFDPTHGDFRVANFSPALKLGFKNFPMDQFGVHLQRLKRMPRNRRSCRDEPRGKGAKSCRAKNAVKASRPYGHWTYVWRPNLGSGFIARTLARSSTYVWRLNNRKWLPSAR